VDVRAYFLLRTFRSITCPYRCPASWSHHLAFTSSWSDYCSDLPITNTAQRPYQPSPSRPRPAPVPPDYAAPGRRLITSLPTSASTPPGPLLPRRPQAGSCKELPLPFLIADLGRSCASGIQNPRNCPYIAGSRGLTCARHAVYPAIYGANSNFIAFAVVCYPAPTVTFGAMGGTKATRPRTALTQHRELLSALFEVKRVIVGPGPDGYGCLASLIAGGHFLIDGVPCVAKNPRRADPPRSWASTFAPGAVHHPRSGALDILGTRIYRAPGRASTSEYRP